SRRSCWVRTPRRTTSIVATRAGYSAADQNAYTLLAGQGEGSGRGAPMADKRHDWFLSQVFHHRAALHRYLAKLTSGAEDIEDLAQETYIRIYALPDYQRIESPKALLFRIAHNLAVDRARQRKARATDTMADLETFTVF